MLGEKLDEVKAGKKLVMTPEMFDEMLRLREEFDSLVETIEILNDKELMEGIKRSKEDIKAGRVHELKKIEDLDKIWAGNADYLGQYANTN